MDLVKRFAARQSNFYKW